MLEGPLQPSQPSLHPPPFASRGFVSVEGEFPVQESLPGTPHCAWRIPSRRSILTIKPVVSRFLFFIAFYVFIFDWAGSSVPHWLFSSCCEWKLLSSCGAQAPR